MNLVAQALLGLTRRIEKVMTSDQQFEIHPFEIFQRLFISVDDVRFGLLGAIDIENLAALFDEAPKPLLRFVFEQADQSLAFLLIGALRNLERLRFDNLLKARVESERGNNGCFESQPQQPERRLSEA